MRRRTTLAVLAPLALVAASIGSAGAAPTSGESAARSPALSISTAAQALPDKREKIKGEVGPGFTITLDEESVPKGRYKIVVEDFSTAHNFHFFGEDVDETTTVPFEGKVKWKVKLKKGTYTAQCDPHSASMNLTLEVTRKE